ncbi:hypothetical protein [Kitasatospora sp. NPDC088346]|uniref:hypothetical protein n=1 Tax=Kitasatospora sp. NPDC088346 TaxID=3364073 RepID=UPI0037F87E54
MTPQEAVVAPGGPQRTVRTTLQWAALILLLVLGVVELLGGSGGLVGSSQAAPGPARTTVEDLARRIGCTADITTDAADIRQGMCTSGGDEIWIATFPTTSARDAWTDEAKDYGGKYLVGDGWVVVLSDATADMLHGLLGGVMMNGVDHSGSHAHSGN